VLGRELKAPMDTRYRPHWLAMQADLCDYSPEVALGKIFRMRPVSLKAFMRRDPD